MNTAAPESWSFTVTNDEKDWRSASWLLARDRWLWRRLLIALAVIWLAYVALCVLPGSLQYGWHWAWVLEGVARGSEMALGVFAFAAMLISALVPWRVRKLFRETAKLAQTTTFTFDARGICSANEQTTTSLEWSKFLRWRENDRVFLLIITQRSYFILSKGQIAPATIEALRSTMSAANVPNR